MAYLGIDTSAGPVRYPTFIMKIDAHGNVLVPPREFLKGLSDREGFGCAIAVLPDGRLHLWRNVAGDVDVALAQ